MCRFVTFYLTFVIVMAQLVIASFVDKQPVGGVPLEDEVRHEMNLTAFIST